MLFGISLSDISTFVIHRIVKITSIINPDINDPKNPVRKTNIITI